MHRQKWGDRPKKQERVFPGALVPQSTRMEHAKSSCLGCCCARRLRRIDGNSFYWPTGPKSSFCIAFILMIVNLLQCAWSITQVRMHFVSIKVSIYISSGCTWLDLPTSSISDSEDTVTLAVDQTFRTVIAKSCGTVPMPLKLCT